MADEKAAEPVADAPVRPAPAPDAAPPRAPFAALGNAVRWLWSKRYPDQPFYLPPTTVRALLCCVLTGSLLWMQWNSPNDGAVPNGLVALGGGAAGFYLGAENSKHMKAVISLAVIAMSCAFYLHRNWIPDSLVALAGTVFGLYFAKTAKTQPSLQ